MKVLIFETERFNPVKNVHIGSMICSKCGKRDDRARISDEFLKRYFKEIK